jgi:phosphate transport system ATP-binding protein
MIELKEHYSIVIVTHNMQQAARVSDMTAFFTVELHDEGKSRTGASSSTRDGQDLHEPGRQAHEDYVTGKFG